MTRRGNAPFAHWNRVFWSSSLLLALAACKVEPDAGGLSAPAPVFEGKIDARPLPLAPVSASADRDTSLLDIQAELASRKQDYDAVIQKAQMRGLLGGALQGGLLGLLITGAPEGAIVGGVTGGAVGYWVSGKAATQIVEEHRNFLIRKWSIETVLKAAMTDTENTRFDLLLSRRALEATRSGSDGPAAIGDTGVMHLAEFLGHAESRALVLHEVIPIFADDPDGVEKLSELLGKQVAMMGDMRKNLDGIEARHE
jgi:hypothetical protein